MSLMIERTQKESMNLFRSVIKVSNDTPVIKHVAIEDPESQFRKLAGILRAQNRSSDLSFPKYEGDPYAIRWFGNNGVLNFIGYWPDEREGAYTQYLNGEMLASKDFHELDAAEKFI